MKPDTNEEWEDVLQFEILEGYISLARCMPHPTQAKSEYKDYLEEMRSYFEKLKSLVRDEIRKAEERGYSKGLEYAEGYARQLFATDYKEDIKESYNQAITDAVGALPDEEDIVQNGNVRSWNYAISEARASLEALKK